MAGYGEIGRRIRELANKHCRGRVLIVQEGGYHLTYLACCLHATLEGLLKLPEPLLSRYPEDEPMAVRAVDDIKNYWKDKVPFLKEET